MKNLFLAIVFLGLAIVPVSHNYSGKHGVKWLTFEEASKLAQKSPKKMLVDVYTDWCGWCKKMDKDTYENVGVAEYINQHYYAVKLNAESSKNITYNSKTMTEQALAGQIFGVSSYPCTVYLDETQKVLTPVPGYLDVPSFTKINRFFGEDFHKKMSWEEFQKLK